MNITRRVKVKRGVALIFALFTIAVLFSIGTTVVALSLHDSRTTRVVNYNEAALHAANWGIEAAINYMGQPGIGFDPNTFSIAATTRRSQWVNTKAYTYNGGNYNYPYGRQLVVTKNISNSKTALNNAVWVEVSSLDSNTLKNEYGLEYDTTKTLGEDKWCANYAGTDLAAGGGTGNNRDGSDSRLISFINPANGENYRLNYGLKGDNYAEVEVVCTEYRYPHSNQPSQYQLLSVARVFANDGVSRDKVPLATRVVDARVRESMACDFMHFIQNARSWDALGVNLGQSNSDYDRKTEAGREIARSSVFLPEGYIESGRLRVDGYGNASNRDPESNPVKKYLNDRGFDGKLGFFSSNSSFDSSKYTFQGDVTTARSSKDYEYKRGKGKDTQKLSNVNGVFSGSLRDGTPSLGLPQAENYFEYATAKSKDHTGNNNTKTINISIAANNNVNTDSSYNYVKSHYGKNGNGKCPDIAQSMTKVSNGKGGFKSIGSAVPTFATVRVEISGDKARIVKYNSAMTNSDGTINNSYVEDLTPKYSGSNTIDISKINNGVINVTGGNVEVVNVKSFAGKDEGLSTDYIDVKNNADKCLDGALTIVSNVNEARDISLNNVGSSNPKVGNSALYSDVARDFYDKNPYVNIPPFSQKQLGIGSSTAKSIWPTPQSSSLEREGNVILASDIAYKSSSNSSPSLGIVAKNYILLNDKSLNSKGNSLDRLEGKLKRDVLRVDAVLMSMDHSVQFDWNNMAANNAKFGNKSDAKTLYEELISNRNIYNSGKNARTFKLNGAIVSGFLDVEGDTNGRGYYVQSFKHDENLRYNLPPIFPRWKVGEFAERGVFGDWMITAYEDKGAISDL